MSARDRLWFPLTSSTVVVSPLLVVLGVVVSMSNAGFVSAYWLELSARSTAGLLFLAPGYAALAAWDAARWRQLALTPVRSWLRLAAVQAGYVAVMSAVTYLLVLVLLWQRHQPVAGLPRLDLVAFGVWVTVAYALVGFTLGRYVPRLAAVPLAFAAVWLWVAYTPAVQPFWLRNVTGSLGTSCCAIDTELASGAVGAPMLFTVALAGACVLLLARASRSTFAVAVATVAIGTSLAASWVADLGPDPVERRAGGQTCRGASVEVCVWPEHAGRLARAVPVLERASDSLRRAGLRVPEKLTEDVPRDGWSFSVGSQRPDAWAGTLATSRLDGLPPSCAGQPGFGWSRGEQYAVSRAWLLVQVGADAGSASADVGAPPGALSELLRLEKPAQVEWFDRALAQMATCERVG